MDILSLDNLDWQPLVLTFKLALVTTILLIIVGIPIAYLLAFSKNKLKIIPEVIISMPLVLPPTVLGFYMLMLFGGNSVVGEWLHRYLGVHLVFSFSGIVLGSMIYSLPFMVQPIQNAFHNLPKSYIETAKILGKTKWQIIRYVLLPNIKNAIVSAIVLTFAHTIGEFGVVLMIGGSIPNQTKVASIAIYEKVEALNYQAAHQYAIILFGISFVILLMIYAKNHFNNNWLIFSRRND